MRIDEKREFNEDAMNELEAWDNKPKPTKIGRSGIKCSREIYVKKRKNRGVQSHKDDKNTSLKTVTISKS